MQKYKDWNQYVKENYTKYLLAFKDKEDAEIIRILDSKPNKTDFIRRLIIKYANKRDS